jgi:hypothetical protein
MRPKVGMRCAAEKPTLALEASRIRLQALTYRSASTRARSRLLRPMLWRPRAPLLCRKQPCLIRGRKPSDQHHIRYMQPRALGRARRWVARTYGTHGSPIHRRRSVLKLVSSRNGCSRSRNRSLEKMSSSSSTAQSRGDMAIATRTRRTGHVISSGETRAQMHRPG